MLNVWLPEHAQRAWSSDELVVLLANHARGNSGKLSARILQRPYASLVAKQEQLGLLRKKPARRAA